MERREAPLLPSCSIGLNCRYRHPPPLLLGQMDCPRWLFHIFKHGEARKCNCRLRHSPVLADAMRSKGRKKPAICLDFIRDRCTRREECPDIHVLDRWAPLSHGFAFLRSAAEPLPEEYLGWSYLGSGSEDHPHAGPHHGAASDFVSYGQKHALPKGPVRHWLREGEAQAVRDAALKDHHGNGYAPGQTPSAPLPPKAPSVQTSAEAAAPAPASGSTPSASGGSSYATALASPAQPLSLPSADDFPSLGSASKPQQPQRASGKGRAEDAPAPAAASATGSSPWSNGMARARIAAAGAAQATASTTPSPAKSTPAPAPAPAPAAAPAPVSAPAAPVSVPASYLEQQQQQQQQQQQSRAGLGLDLPAIEAAPAAAGAGAASSDSISQQIQQLQQLQMQQEQQQLATLLSGLGISLDAAASAPAPPASLAPPASVAEPSVGGGNPNGGSLASLQQQLDLYRHVAQDNHQAVAQLRARLLTAESSHQQSAAQREGEYQRLRVEQASVQQELAQLGALALDPLASGIVDARRQHLAAVETAMLALHTAHVAADGEYRKQEQSAKQEISERLAKAQLIGRMTDQVETDMLTLQQRQQQQQLQQAQQLLQQAQQQQAAAAAAAAAGKSSSSGLALNADVPPFSIPGLADPPNSLGSGADLSAFLQQQQPNSTRANSNNNASASSANNYLELTGMNQRLLSESAPAFIPGSGLVGSGLVGSGLVGSSPNPVAPLSAPPGLAPLSGGLGLGLHSDLGLGLGGDNGLSLSNGFSSFGLGSLSNGGLLAAGRQWRCKSCQWARNHGVSCDKCSAPMPV
jgi:hypothetical protein